MQFYDIGAGIFLYIISGLFLYQSQFLADPESRLVPYYISVFLIVLATLLIIKRLRNKDKEIYDFTGSKKAFVFCILMLIYIFFVDVLGFYVVTLIFLVVSMWILGLRNKMQLILVPIGTIVFLYLTFDLLFQLPIPKGLLY